MAKAPLNPSQETGLAIPDNSGYVDFNDEALSRIESFADAAAMLEEAGIPVEDGAQYGNGFAIVDKKTLVGEPMILLSWRFNEGKGAFVSVEAVTEKGLKVVFNDGSEYGVCAQLAAITRKRQELNHRTPQTGLIVRKGLSESSYTNDAGIEATTYRLVFS